MVSLLKRERRLNANQASGHDEVMALAWALAAADITRFLTSVTSRLVLLPNAFAAARIPLTWTY